VGHIKTSHSTWNTPIFVIKKKSEKWCLLQDLSSTNKVMQPMGCLQVGLPLPITIPLQNYLYIIDLKDSFLNILLHEEDGEKFAISVLMPNHQVTYKLYHWKVLPQCLTNSPTMCQEFVASTLELLRQKFNQAYNVHYMDDILFNHSDLGALQSLLAHVLEQLPKEGIMVASKKGQNNLLFHIGPEI
jgi:hypothetical protein